MVIEVDFFYILIKVIRKEIVLLIEKNNGYQDVVEKGRVVEFMSQNSGL